MNRRTIIALVVAMAAIIGWQFLATRIYDYMGWYQPGEKEAIEARKKAEDERLAAATTRSTTGPATTQTARLTTAPVERPTSVPAGQLQVLGGTAATRPVLGSDKHDDPNFALQLRLNPQGAALDSVTLNRFFETVKKQKLYSFEHAPLNASAKDVPFATQTLTLDGKDVDLAGVTWEVVGDGASDRRATFRAIVRQGDRDVVELRKTYACSQPAGNISEDEKKARAYEVWVTYSLQNLDSKEHKAKLVFNGPVSPQPENYNDQPMVYWGYDNEPNTVVESVAVSSIVGDKKDHDLEKGKYRTLWAGTANAYFDAIARPAVEKMSKGTAWPIAKIKAVPLPGKDEKDARQNHAVVVFETDEVTLTAAGDVKELPLEVFVGPKLRKVLNTTYYDSSPRRYDETLKTGGSCGLCTFAWLVNLLVILLNFFHTILFDWGLAIMALVLLVRLLLHPITKKSQISMSKMSKMGPAMEKLKQKYADDPEALRRAQAEFIREQGIAPFLGCLPMFLQMPIWIALWSSLQSTFELRHEPFLWGFTWIKDLAQPDRLIDFGHIVVPGFLCFQPGIDAINILPILMGVVFFIQSKLQKPPTMSKEQEQQQKMMTWMTFLLFPLLLYNGPSGLNLYILTSTLIGIWESKRVKKHLAEQEEAEKSGKVIIDAPATRAGKRLAGDKDKEQPKKGGLTGWLANLQAKAEEMRRDAEKRKGKPKG